MLYSLQYARAIAAILVVHAHLAGFAVFAPAAPSGIGGFGVDIFFVISGFIMWHTARELPPGTFVVRRLIRIVPIYWFYTLLLVVVALAAPALAPKIDVSLQTVLGSLFFVPYMNAAGGIQPILLQGWTLNYEMFFYAVFALCLFLPGQRLRFVAVAVALLALAAFGAVARPGNPIIATYCDSILIEFIFGMVLAAVPSARALPALVKLALVVISLVVLIVGEGHALWGLPRFLALGVPALLFVWSIMGLENAAKKRPSKVALALGDASYSLYLCHPFVLSAVAALGRVVIGRGWLPEGLLTAVVLCLVALLGCAAASVLSFRLIERPLGRRLTSATKAQFPSGGLPQAQTTSRS